MQMSQSIFGRIGGGGCVVMWACPEILVWLWIEQYSWRGTKKLQHPFHQGIKKGKRKQMNVSFPHNSFSVDPSTEMFTDSYHSPSFSHLSLDMFQKKRSFHLPSRCEEICSLMAFKTGSTDNKKREVRETLRFPVPHFSRRILCGAECCGTLLPCQGANCASHTDLHLQATWYHLSNRRILPLNGFAQSQWSLNAIQGSSLELCFEFVCYCVLCSQLLCKKKNPLSLNWIVKGLY